MSGLVYFYAGASIFGIGVILFDLIGHFVGGSDDGGHGDGDVGLDMDHDGDIDIHGDFNGHVDTDGDFHMDGHGEDGSVLLHDKSDKKHRAKGNIFLRIVSWARTLVYFAAGFGPVGLFGELVAKVDYSIIWSVSVGLVTVGGALLFRWFQRRETDSTIKTQDILYEKGEVIVSIKENQMGKVRIRMAGGITERYAKAEKPDIAYPLGTKIIVVDYTDSFVLVREDT